jgi:hypothetical protein
MNRYIGSQVDPFWCGVAALHELSTRRTKNFIKILALRLLLLLLFFYDQPTVPDMKNVWISS